MKMKQQQQQSSSSSPPIFHIIGSMYVDLFCYLQNDIPVRGGDSYLLQPVSIQPGGSTTNTATHLNTFRIHHQQNQNQKKQQSEQHKHEHEQEQQNREQQNKNNNNNNNVDYEPNFCDSTIIIHSSINENDNYGKILLQHTSKYDIKLINYRLKHQQQQQQQVQIQSTEDNNGNDNDNNNNNNNNTYNNTDSSTPHCVVIVADNERSFMSYQGCIDSFFPSIIDWTSILNNTQPIHIHIAGYYCTTGFINGQLLSSVQYIYKEKQRRQCQQSQQRDDDSIILSLVTQSDATHQWDGGIYDLIPYLDYIIMNYDEATNIYQHGCTSKQQRSVYTYTDTDTDTDTNTDTDKDELTNQLIQYFTSCNTTVCYVVTRGPNGAIAFRNGQIIASINAAVQVPIDTNDTTTNIVLDPTGAGDAFAAGFLYGIWNTSNIQSDSINHNHNDANDNDADTRMIFNKTRIQNGLSWGCACGTAIVQIRGASTPASYETIHDLFLKQQQNENEI